MSLLIVPLLSPDCGRPIARPVGLLEVACIWHLALEHAPYEAKWSPERGRNRSKTLGQLSFYAFRLSNFKPGRFASSLPPAFPAREIEERCANGVVQCIYAKALA